jgi:DNA-binding transcriptional LysR family regulator
MTARVVEGSDCLRDRFSAMRLLAILVMWLTPLAGFSADLRVVGSDLLGADFAGALEVFAKRENVRVSTAFAGSRAGLDDLKNGRADVALVAFAPDEKLPDGVFVAQPLAYRIAVVAVPEHIGVTQISFNALDGFFGANGPAGFSIWRDIGVTDSAAQWGVSTHVLMGEGGGLSVDLFTRTALRMPKLKSSVLRYDGFGALKGQLSAAEGGLAVLPYVPQAGSGMRALLVEKVEGEPGFGPTPENIHTGDYPLRLPVYVVYRTESATKLGTLLAFFWSEDVARSLAKNPVLTPVPASGRGRTR